MLQVADSGELNWYSDFHFGKFGRLNKGKSRFVFQVKAPIEAIKGLYLFSHMDTGTIPDHVFAKTVIKVDRRGKTKIYMSASNPEMEWQETFVYRLIEDDEADEYIRSLEP